MLGFYANDVRESLLELEATQRAASDIKVASRPFLAPGDAWEISIVDYAGALERFRRQRATPWQWLRQRSVLIERCEPAVRQLKKLLERRRETRAGVAERSCDEIYDVFWGITAWILKRLDEEVRAAGATLLVFTVPPVSQLEVDDARRAPSCVACPCSGEPPPSRIAAICEQLGIPFVDLYPRIPPDGATLYDRSDLHWTAAGHALAAEAVQRRSRRSPRRRKRLAGSCPRTLNSGSLGLSGRARPGSGRHGQLGLDIFWRKFTL